MVKNYRINIRISKELYNYLLKISKNDGLTISKVVEDAIITYHAMIKLGINPKKVQEEFYKFFRIK